jgi:methylphosphotriester-DNA--protein-cysteine methyltransferase
VVIHASATENIALRLHPLAAAPLLGVCPAHLTDGTFSIDDLWGAFGRQLEDAVAAAPTAEERRALIGAALHARHQAASRRESPGHARVGGALRLLHARGGQLQLRALAHELQISPRQLEREFRTHVGLAPKRYARIVRLHGALRELAATHSKTDAALAAGLHDQAHLSREARDLTGATLTELTRSPHVATAVAITTFD